jgi:hypothetical protein
MKAVGERPDSPSRHIGSRKLSVFPIHPSAVPVMIASGHDIPLVSKTFLEVTIALLNIGPILLACIGLKNCL